MEIKQLLTRLKEDTNLILFETNDIELMKINNNIYNNVIEIINGRI